VIHPHRVLANKGSHPGDRLLFTKSLGTGVISTAIKKGTAKQEWIDSAVKSMTTLNKTAADVITKGSVGPGFRFGQAECSSAGQSRVAVPTWFVHALTDVTGFGLIGHAREMALASDVSLVLHSAKIPLLEGALDCVRAGNIPGGLNANRDFAECLVEYENGIPEEMKTILFDPQTAGGLLISVSSEDATALARALQAASVPAVEIGEVLPRTKPLIRVT